MIINQHNTNTGANRKLFAAKYIETQNGKLIFEDTDGFNRLYRMVFRDQEELRIVITALVDLHKNYIQYSHFYLNST